MASAYVTAGVPQVSAALAAQVVRGSPVKLALTRQQMFSGVGSRRDVERLRQVPHRLDPEARKEAMKIIRASEWFGEPAPVVQVSPHSVSSRWL